VLIALLVRLSLSATLLREEKAFLAFMRRHHLTYVGAEYEQPRDIFISNLGRIREFNSQRHSFALGLTRQACMTPSKYRILLGCRPSANWHRIVAKGGSTDPPPPAVDWRDKGAVTDVKDQLQCGSDWAFSATSAQESRHFIARGELLVLSEQNLIDCLKTCYGCDGGWPSAAYDGVIREQGGHFMTSEDDPYIGRPSFCTYTSDAGVTNITGWTKAAPGDEAALMAAVAEGPVTAVIDASHTSFQLYSTGIYNEPACSSVAVNHGVGIVGYGTEVNTDFRIVRNLWGITWGEGGYIRMSRNRKNQCGIATDAVFPTGQ
jgi:cathepsin L